MNPQIQQYITECRTKGIPDDSIRKSLLDAGWSSEMVNAVLPPAIAAPAQPMTPVAAVHNKRIRDNLPSLLIRIGLAFVFTFAAVSISMNPAEGVHFMPSYVAAIIPPKFFLPVFGVFEVILSIWLLTGKWSRYSGLLAALVLIGITSLNIGDISVLFRNVAIVFAALSLFTMSFEPKGK